MTSATFTVLPVVSGSAGIVGYDPVPPNFIIGAPTPASKFSSTTITVPITANDNGGISISGISNLTPLLGNITSPLQIDTQNVSFVYEVTATGALQLSASDLAGNTATCADPGYVIGAFPIDADHPPSIQFSNYDPIDRTILNSTDNYGSVRVTVRDKHLGNEGSISPTANNVALTSASVGRIDYSSIVQSKNFYEIQFDVVDISATGDVIVSATDDYGFSTIESDGEWIIGCSANDRMINIKDWLPTYLKDSETYQFAEFFENFLNTMYENRDCNIGILEKIERLSTLHDPEEIDIEYIQFFANNLGYEVNVNRGDLGVFGKTTSDAVSASDDDINKYLRFVVKNLPNWYQIKTTRNSIKIMLFSFGIIGDIAYQWTSDYKNNWQTEATSGGTEGLPSNFFPSPHFMIQVDLNQTPPTWTDNIDYVINAIDSIRPVNTVFDQIAGIFDGGKSVIGLNASFRTQYVYSIPWTTSTAFSSTNMISTSS